MKSIAFICNYSWVGMSTSVINSAIFWESQGYFVDVYCEKPDIIQFPLPVFKNKKISFIISNIDKKSIISDFYFRKNNFKTEPYEFIVGVDFKGIIRAFIVSVFKKSKIIYHSLEFFEPEKLGIKNLVFKTFEIIGATKSKYIFTQDPSRLRFLQYNLFQSKNKFKIIYNTPIGGFIKEKTNYFRDLFKIDKEKKIVLAVGSLIKEHYIIQLVNSISSWDEKFVLVVHGWFPDEQIKILITRKMRKYPSRLFLSTFYFNDSEKYIPFKACDIGFVGFEPLNNNLKYAAGSAGKLFDFMRCGTPILAFNTPGMIEIIEEREVGICFNTPKEINSALNLILENHTKFKNNCFESFPNFEFMQQYKKVYDSLVN
ncbi:MAG: glycosyltransferase [Lutibacter sp.]|nr:glycosyltransferase [Lutibacter sp.]